MDRMRLISRRHLLIGGASTIALADMGQRAVAARQSWRINPARTSVGFIVDAIGWPQTKGQFREFDGKIAIDFENPQASYVTFRVAAKSVDVGSQAFNEYLRTDAFFDAARFPYITFESTHVEKMDSQHGHVTGILMLRGISQPLTIDVMLDRDSNAVGNQLGFRATGTIHRLAFNMNAGFPAISNDVALIVATEAVIE